jgi:hypothetical protein
VTKLNASCVLGLVSFDCHPRSSFFLTSEAHVVIAHLCLLLLTPLALSPQKATPILTTTLALSLSLSLLRRSLARSVCSNVPVSLSRSLPPVARTLRSERGQSGRRPRRPPRCRHGRDAASDHPPQSRSPRRKSSSSWKLIGPFYWNSSAILILLCVIGFFVWWIMFIWCMECRRRLLLSLGCTDDPKKIGRIS